MPNLTWTGNGRKEDELLNKRASEGWELVTYDYMATSTQIKSPLKQGSEN